MINTTIRATRGDSISIPIEYELITGATYRAQIRKTPDSISFLVLSIVSKNITITTQQSDTLTKDTYYVELEENNAGVISTVQLTALFLREDITRTYGDPPPAAWETDESIEVAEMITRNLYIRKVDNSLVDVETIATDTEAAKDAATVATGLANTATSNANTATGLANTATSNANTATGLANTATSNANTATGLANTATANADAATVAATEAAANANSALSIVKSHTHRILLVAPEGKNYSCLIGAEDAYNGGYTTECCSWDAFVINASEWKNKVDVLVFFNLNVGQGTNATGAEIEAAMLAYKAAGVKMIFINFYSGALRKYSPDGTATNNYIRSTVLDAISASTKPDVNGGAFVHNSDYPFTDEIIRTEVVGPSTSMYNYTSTNASVIFPVLAVLGEVSVNCTFYKPGAYFAMQYAGEVVGNAPQDANYKYINLDKIIDALLGKTVRARLAIDCKYGKKIAAAGFDGDLTTDMVAVQTLADAVGRKRPLGLSLYASKITPALAGFYRGLKGWVSLVSHTENHFNILDTVTDEVHVIGADQTIRLYRPNRAVITSVKSFDGLTTYTFKTNAWNINTPTGTDYLADTITTSPIELNFGILKFSVAQIGNSVKVTYSCIQNEYKEILGSLETLKANGAITDNAVYLTGGINGTHPYTAMLAEKNGVVLCDHMGAPSYQKAAFYAFLRKDKFTIPVSSMFKTDASGVIRDTTLFLNTKAYNIATLIPQAIAYCKKYDLPYEWYDHDFISSETYPSGMWLGSADWNADYKKPTYEETRVYVGDMYKQLYDLVDAQGVQWMPREDCVRRLDYINKYIEYDVTVSGGKVRITVTNTGNKQIDGLSFRIPFAANPSLVNRLKHGALTYTYASAICMTWLNVAPGITEVIEVS